MKLSEIKDILINPKNANSINLLSDAIDNLLSEKITYNPILIVGNSGTGKTFLLNKISEILKEKAIYYHIKDLEFLYNSNLYLDTMQEISKYKCILLDSLHLLYNNEKAQDELSFFVEKLIINQILLIMTISYEDFEKELKSELKSRINMGLILLLVEPDLEIKMRYVKLFADKHEIKLSKEQNLLLARKCEQFRSIQSCLINIKAFYQSMEYMPDNNQFEKIILNSRQAIDLTSEKILNSVGKYFGFSVKELKGSKRFLKLVEARQIAMYLCRNLLGLSFMEIGDIFNGKDHTTVIYSVRKIEKIMFSDKVMNKLVTEVTNRCKNDINSQ